METGDYYSILQVDHRATQEQIRQAYKRLALDVHPDLSAHPEANQRMQLLNEAYSVLSDAEKRAEYDRSQQANSPTAAPAAEDGWVVEWPAEAASTAGRPVYTPAPEPHDTPVDPEKQRELERKRNRWLLRQMKILAVAVLLTVVLFGWSLFAGEFTLWVILLLMSPVVYVLVILIRLVRWPR